MLEELSLVLINIYYFQHQKLMLKSLWYFWYCRWIAGRKGEIQGHQWRAGYNLCRIGWFLNCISLNFSQILNQTGNWTMTTLGQLITLVPTAFCIWEVFLNSFCKLVVVSFRRCFVNMARWNSLNSGSHIVMVTRVYSHPPCLFTNTSWGKK